MYVSLVRGREEMKIEVEAQDPERAKDNACYISTDVNIESTYL